jgi:hypothetical protein
MLKTGNIFLGQTSLNEALQENLGIRFPQNGWIPHVPVNPDSRDIRDPNIGAAKHIFYSEDFFPTGRWNEFDGISKEETWNRCLNAEWLYNNTNIIHEILSPLANPEMPGAEKRNHYEPFFDLRKASPDATQRLIFGQFRNLPNAVANTYIFLGLYEYDTNYYNLGTPDKYIDDKESFRRDLVNCENVEPYKIDEASFPKDKILAKMEEDAAFQSFDKEVLQSGLITYKHQVWRRIEDHWPL